MIQPAPERHGDRLDLAVDLQLPEDVLDVVADGRVREVQLRRDVQRRVAVRKRTTISRSRPVSGETEISGSAGGASAAGRAAARMAPNEPVELDRVAPLDQVHDAA